MNHLEATRTVAGSVATNSSTTALLRLDTLGHDYASIDVIYGRTLAGGTNSSVAQVLTFQHSDAPTSGYTAVSGYQTVAAPAFAANTASSTSETVIRFDVDLRGKRRYLEVASSPNTLATVMVVARLGKSEEHGTSATQKGAAIAYRG